MKTILLLLSAIGITAFGQNYKTATSQKWTQNGWEDVTRTLNTLNSDGTVKEAVFQSWLLAPANTWASQTRTSYTYNANQLPTVMLFEIYDNGSSSWKYDRKETTAYGTGTAVLSVVTETSANGTTFLNSEKRTSNYSGNLRTGIDVAIWQSGSWLKLQTISYSYNSNGKVDTINVQVLDTVTGNYRKQSLAYYSYYPAADTMVRQYWKNSSYENFIRFNSHYMNGKIDFVSLDYYNLTNQVWDKSHKVSSIYNGNVLIEERTRVWNETSNDYIEDYERVLYTYEGTVGLKEYFSDGGTPVYFDLGGNRIEKRYNEVMIEKNGPATRKVIIQK